MYCPAADFGLLENFFFYYVFSRCSTNIRSTGSRPGHKLEQTGRQRMICDTRGKNWYLYDVRQYIRNALEKKKK